MFYGVTFLASAIMVFIKIILINYLFFSYYMPFLLNIFILFF